MNNRVVITGTGLVSSLGLTVSETWEAMLAGRCGIKSIEGFDASGLDCRLAAQVCGLGPSELAIHPRDSRIMDKHSYMLMKSGRDAFRQSRLDSKKIAPEDIGYYAGMGMVDYNVEDLLPSVLQTLDGKGHLDYDKFYSSAYQQIHPLWPLSMLNNINFCQVAIDLGIKGENTTFSPHADSGMHAIIEAYNTIIEGKAKVVLAGGVSEKISPMSIARALWFGILAKNNAACAPFSEGRPGTILGEGAGTLSLELQSTANERSVPCLAAITGYGASFGLDEKSGGTSIDAIALSMKEAIKKAGLQPKDIGLIIAHGDGTYGDKNETDAIHQTFADCIQDTVVYSSKAALGNMLAGSSPVDVILAINIIKNGIIPASCRPLLPSRDIKFNLVGAGPLHINPKRVLINSRSYEGQCASLIIEAVE